jgi:hypothetical protein
MHNPYDNCGPHILGLDKDDITAQEELAAFDQLGPLTRRVIDEKMCVRWSSHQTLEAIKTLWHSDPFNPAIDRRTQALETQKEVFDADLAEAELKLEQQREGN